MTGTTDLGRVKDIRLADEVWRRATASEDKFYPFGVDAGFDAESGIFWMKQGLGRGGLYESIAKQLVFKPTARPIDLLALERTLEMQISDPSFRYRTGAESDKDDDDVIPEYPDRYEHDAAGEDGVDAAPGEAVFGHSPFEPDATRNTPTPGPIPIRPAKPSRRRMDRFGEERSDHDNSGPRATLELEKEHIEALKRNHYTSHCQMCLCERPPHELAPAGSYIQWEEVRRRVVESHHVDLKSAGGARHAGNLILLCKLHHDNFGRRLTRTAVTAALRCKGDEKTIGFSSDGKTASEVTGRQIELRLSDTHEIVRIFFTNEHARYWLSQARSLDNSTSGGVDTFVSSDPDD